MKLQFRIGKSEKNTFQITFKFSKIKLVPQFRSTLKKKVITDFVDHKNGKRCSRIGCSNQELLKLHKLLLKKIIIKKNKKKTIPIIEVYTNTYAAGIATNRPLGLQVKKDP